MKSRSYHHGDLREALLVAAEELLVEGGVQGLTLRACARRAGVSHAAPKHHFDDVADLLSEVAARSYDRLSDALELTQKQAGSDPADRFIALARAYVGFSRQYPANFRLMFRSDALNDQHENLKRAASRAFALMTSSITVLRSEADVTVDTLQDRIKDKALQNDILIGWSHIHGYAQLLLEGQFDGFADAEGVDEFVERTLRDTGARLSEMLRAR